jgi:hypothetical protein
MSTVVFDIEEVWAPAPDIAGDVCLSDRYEVSNFGRVRSVPYEKTSRNINGYFSYTTKQKMCKLQTSVDGYSVLHVSRKVKGKKIKKSIFVHRLVATLWVDNPDKDTNTQVNHIDGDKKNNTPSNLEWVTPQENVRHSYDTGLASNKCERHPRATMTNEQVVAAREFYENCGNIQLTADEFGIKYQTMWKILRNKNYKEVV